MAESQLFRALSVLFFLGGEIWGSLKDPCGSPLDRAAQERWLFSAHSFLWGEELEESERGHNKMCVPNQLNIISALLYGRPKWLRGSLNGLYRGSADTVVTDRRLLSACRSSLLHPKQRMERNFSPAEIFSKILLTVLLSTCAAFLEPFDLLYENAVHAFYNSEYDGVVRDMEGALSSYKEVRRTKVRCRVRCQDQHPFDDTFSDLRFFDVVLKRAACMNACIEETLGSQSVHKVSEDVVQDFNRKIPYNYLLLAYQKVRGKGSASQTQESGSSHC